MTLSVNRLLCSPGGCGAPALLPSVTFSSIVCLHPVPRSANPHFPAATMQMPPANAVFFQSCKIWAAENLKTQSARRLCGNTLKEIRVEDPCVCSTWLKSSFLGVMVNMEQPLFFYIMWTSCLLSRHEFTVNGSVASVFVATLCN